ncbi:MAG: hypothetical protein ACXV2J_11445 [Actinomycetes bacterium]
MSALEPVEISAGRLQLRPWQAEDAEELFDAFTEPHIQRWH